MMKTKMKTKLKTKTKTLMITKMKTRRQEEVLQERRIDEWIQDGEERRSGSKAPVS